MSAPVARAAPSVPRLTESLVQLLSALVHAARPGRLELRARSYAGFGYEQFSILVPDRGGSYTVLPDALLRRLEDRWALEISAATRGPSGDAPQDLACVFSRWRLERKYIGSAWQIDPADVAAVLAKVDAFSLPPSFALDNSTELVAVWNLSSPIPLDRDGARAAQLQRALAEKLGASTHPLKSTTPSRTGSPAAAVETTADDPGGVIPLPGSIVRDCGSDAPVVRFLVVAPERRYSIHDLEAALAPAAASPRSPKKGVLP